MVFPDLGRTERREFATSRSSPNPWNKAYTYRPFGKGASVAPTEQSDGGVFEALRADLNTARNDYGRAMSEAGRLQAELEAANVVAARADSLMASEAEARARVEQLASEIANLRRWLTWRTISLEILLLGVASISAVMWLTRWWPWQ